MITAQEFLSSILKTVQLSQYILSLAMAAASSHALKSKFQTLLQEYDRIESEIQSTAARRGWEPPELQPARRWLCGFRFRYGLQDQDSTIAERLIHLFTSNSIALRKQYNLWDQADEQTLTLFQKTMDCQTIGIRLIQPYL